MVVTNYQRKEEVSSYEIVVPFHPKDVAEKENKIVLVDKRIDIVLNENHSQENSYQTYPLEDGMVEKTEENLLVVNKEIVELYVLGIDTTIKDVVVVVSYTYLVSNKVKKVTKPSISKVDMVAIDIFDTTNEDKKPSSIRKVDMGTQNQKDPNHLPRT